MATNFHKDNFAKDSSFPADRFFIRFDEGDGDPRMSPTIPLPTRPPIGRSHVEERLQRRRSGDLDKRNSLAEARRNRSLEVRRSQLIDQKASREERRRQRLMEETQRGLQLARRLSEGIASAEERRAEMQEHLGEARGERSRHVQETVAETRRRIARETRESWCKMREREFVIQFRRERLRCIPRSKILEAPVEKGQTLNEAATLIQNAWGLGKLRPTIAPFLQAGLYEVNDFEKAKEVIMDRKVILSATNFITRMIKCDPIVEKLLNVKQSGRILLTAILLGRFGQEVMPETSPEELSLLEHASSLSESLHSYLEHPHRTGLLRVTERWAVFSEAFVLWQTSNKATLVSDMQRDYLALSEIAMTLGEAAKREWMPHVNRHQARLRKALLRVAGNSAIIELEGKLKDLQASPQPADGVDKDEMQPAALNLGSQLAEPEQIKLVEDALIDGESILSNVKIAHELTIDEAFDFKSLMKIKTGRDYTPHVRPLEGFHGDMDIFLEFVFSVKQQLLEMVQSKGPIAQLLVESLDESLLREQQHNNALDPFALLEFLVADCMSKVCAPARDAAIERLTKRITAKADGLQELSQQIAMCLLMMHEDLANFGLKTARPRLLSLIVSYEREHFAKTMQGKTLHHARDMAGRAKRRLEGTGGVVVDKKPLEVIHDVVAECVLSLLNYSEGGPDPCSIDEHELLTLDHHRLHRMRGALERMLTISVLELALRNLQHPSIEMTIARCNALLLDNGTCSEESLVAEVGKSITDAALTSSVETAVRRIVFTGQDPILAIVKRRIGTLLRSSLARGEGEIDCKPVAILKRNGLSEVIIEEFNQLVRELDRMFRLHVQVYAPVYNNFIQSCTNDE